MYKNYCSKGGSKSRIGGAGPAGHMQIMRRIRAPIEGALKSYIARLIIMESKMQFSFFPLCKGETY